MRASTASMAVTRLPWRVSRLPPVIRSVPILTSRIPTLRTFPQPIAQTRRTMSSGHIHNSNAACCSIPPVESDYKPKGSYQKVGSFDKAYVVRIYVSARARSAC